MHATDRSRTTPARRLRRAFALGLGVALGCAAYAASGCSKPTPQLTKSSGATPLPEDDRSGDAAAMAAHAPSSASDGGGASAPAPVPGQIVELIYGGELKSNWSDYGWADRVITGPGPARLNFSDRAGWIIASPKLRDSGGLSRPFGGVSFRVKAPADFGEFLEVRLSSPEGDFESVRVTATQQTALPDGWAQVFMPMRTLNPHGQAFDRVRIRAFRPVGKAPVFLDLIGLTAPSATPDPPIAYPSRDVKMVVHCARASTPISPYIYGVAAGEPPDQELRATAHRWGGNPTSRFNWQLGNAWNTGSDYYYQNVSVDPFSKFMAVAKERRAFTAITVPTIGWVAKDTQSYSFSVKVLGAQKDGDGDHPDRGNGVRPDGSEIVPPHPSQTSVPAPPDMIGSWVTSIRMADEAAGAPTVRSYILDNEPALWDSTHRDVHPEPLTYDELLDRTVRYGAAIRAADPRAVIAGPAEWGWPNYFFSAKDAKAGFRNKPDRRAHGDVPLLAWYLQKLKEHEQKTGERLLDVLDLHFYPQAKEVFQNHGGGGVDAATVALRFRSTRALWDPTYIDESWIKEAVNLIPRLKDLIAQNYPGRGISIGEWNFGAETHISGGLALAEALGRFAQGGVQSAYYWTRPKTNSPAYWGFRAFRNYDGKGGAFLDNFISSEAPDGSSLFVSRDATGTRMVLIAMNFEKDTSAKIEIDMSSCGARASRKTFTYAGEPAGMTESKAAPSDTAKSLAETLLPRSIAVFELAIAPAGGARP